jgi:NADH dehydrogenase
MQQRIVVLGAGYAGAHTAGRLARRLDPRDVRITVVNADPDFVERIRNHQLATGQRLRHRPLSEVFAGTGVVVREARVSAVDVDRRTVQLAGQDDLAYDTLVVALGSTVDDHGVPGVAEHAHHVAGRAAALRLRERLRALAAGATVLVVGGGLTGIETATEIAGSRPDLHVAIAGSAGTWLSQKARQHLRETFDRLGIGVHEHAEVVRVDASGVLTDTGSRIPADVTVWTAGFATHPIAAATALEVAADGRIVVDDTMRSVSHPDVYAVGDAGIAVGAGDKPLRMSCASGIPMGWRAADAIAARLTGREIPDKTIGYSLQCISLGRRDAIVQFVTPDDRVKPSVLSGRVGAWVKEFICAGAGWSVAHPTVLVPTRRRRVGAVPADQVHAR